jgi:hypothetical protein
VRAGTWRRRTAYPRGGAWPDPTGWVWPPAILNVTVPPGLIATWAGCRWRRCRRSPRCAWSGRARRRRGAGGRWYRREAVASPAGVSCLEGRGLTGSTVRPATTCVCGLPAREGSDPRWCSRPSHLADDPDCERDPDEGQRSPSARTPYCSATHHHAAERRSPRDGPEERPPAYPGRSTASSRPPSCCPS